MIPQVGILECKNLKKMDITGASGEQFYVFSKRSNLVGNLQEEITMQIIILLKN